MSQQTPGSKKKGRIYGREERRQTLQRPSPKSRIVGGSDRRRKRAERLANEKQDREKNAEPVPTDKRNYFKQADFPAVILQQAQKIAAALVDNYAGKEASPPDVALAIGVSPTSSAWPQLAGSSIAYGLTEGGVNANTIKLTALGRKLVALKRKVRT